MIPLPENSDLFTLMDTKNDEFIAEKAKVLTSTELQILNNKGIYILHKAAKLGYVKTTEAIFNNLEQQTAVWLIALIDNTGYNVLHIAAMYGRAEVVQLLLAKAPGLICAKTSVGANLLHIAAMYGRAEVVQLLLAKAPELIRTPNPAGDNALHIAAAKGCTEVVGLLLAKDPDLIFEKNSAGANALHIAAWKGHTEVVELLLAKYPELIREKTSAGDNALHVAAKHGRAEVVELLLGKDSELIFEKNPAGDNVLHIAAWKGHTEVVQLLLEKDTELKLIREKTSAGANALHIAARHGHTEVVELLLAKYPELIREKTSAGDNALHIAARHGHTEVVKLLLAKYPGLIREKNSAGDNALHIAARHGHTEVVKLLLAKDSELIREKNSAGDNALRVAAKHGHTEILKLLLAKAPGLICETAPARINVPCLPRQNFTANDPERVIVTLLSAFFESETYKEEPTKRLLSFLQMLKSQKYLNANFEKLLLPYKNDIQALVDNEKCARNKTIENGESSLKLAKDLGIDDYLLKTKERNLLGFIKYARPDLAALSYIQSQDIATDHDIPIKQVVADVAARYTDSGYDFHPKLRKKILALTECIEWKFDESPFKELTQDKLKNIGLFLDYALELEMSLVRAGVQSDWAKKSLNSKPQKRITDFFCSGGDKQEGKREREDEDFVQVGRECKRRKMA